MEQGLEVVYHLYSYTHKHNVTVKTRLPQEEARVPSVTSVWKGADWHEREAAEMFGIVFEGHPNLVPLLLPEDMTDHHPLRKDNPLAEIEEWQGVRAGVGPGEAAEVEE
jgi:NADH-quinone oxidoreductase subunit C